MAEIVTKRCEHLLKFEGMAHGHVIVLDRETQYIMCDACYAKLYQRLFADQMPKTWLDNPLIEPDKTCYEPLQERKRPDLY
jgi:hypothetical protein